MHWRHQSAPHPADPAQGRAEYDAELEDGVAVKGFLWTLFCFKIATVVAIFWAAGASREAGILLSATTWPWLIIPLLAVSGTLVFHYRLRRARARRATLLRSEWMVDEGQPEIGARPVRAMQAGNTSPEGS